MPGNREVQSSTPSTKQNKQKRFLPSLFCKTNGVSRGNLSLKFRAQTVSPDPCSSRTGVEASLLCATPSRTAGALAVQARKEFAIQKLVSLVARRRPRHRPRSLEEAEQVLSRLPSREAAEEAARRARASEARARRPERLAGVAGSSWRAAPWGGGRSRREEFTPCVLAEPGPREPPT